MRYQVTIPVEILETIGEQRATKKANRLAENIARCFGVTTTFCGKTKIDDPENIGLRECIDAYAERFWDRV